MQKLRFYFLKRSACEIVISVNLNIESNKMLNRYLDILHRPVVECCCSEEIQYSGQP